MKTWCVRDVMTTDVATVAADTPYREIVDTLADRRVSAVPVLDAFQRVIGVVSESDLMHKVEFAGDDQLRSLLESRRQRTARAKAAGDVARELMTAPAVTALASTPLAAAARTMDTEQVKRLPVVDDLGRLIGIVTRGDLLRVFRRSDEEIRTDIAEDVLRRSLWLDASTVQAQVDRGVVTLTGHVDTRSLALLTVRLTAAVPGVVDVVSKLECEFDDTKVAPVSARAHPFGSSW